MIQHTPRQPNAGTASTHQDGPETWGQWSGRKQYSLEVVQHPLRARMCGFGDKDRRPLAPAAVAKMIVRREDDSIVEVDDVDSSFFLVTVDLWSADGKHEMNLVLHPSSADRYVPQQTSTKTRRRGTSTSAPSSRTAGNHTPVGRGSPAPSYRSIEQPTSGTSPSALSAHPPYGNQAYFGPQVPPTTENVAFPQGNQYGPPTSATNPWGYSQVTPVDRGAGFPPPPLPSIHTFTPNTSETWQPEAGMLPYRAWNTDTAYAPVDNFSSQNLDPALRTPSSDTRDNGSWSQPNNYTPALANPETDQNNIYAPTGYPPPYTQYPQPTPGTPTSSQAAATMPPLPRHTYTRTLVGPLSANACRLLDEHRKPGIFFLFQDLSVRTEGTFRLRMRLINVGAPPAPEIGSMGVHTDVSPVLAQTFTEQFTVFSAKRFPGVPDTTALSIAFGNQGQKLPLRNRHGSNKRRRRGESESSSDSDA